MATFQIDVPDDLIARARQAGWRDVGAYLLSLMRADLDGVTPAVEAMLLERLNAPDVGEMTDRDFDAIRQRVQAAAKERRG